MQARAPHQLVGDAYRLYRHYPLLFFVLASSVVVPYAVILLLATGDGPLDQSSLSAGASLIVTVVDLALIAPLISALHVHAVASAREGHDPRLGPVARQGLRALPTVAAASIISWLGIILGFAALIVPGVFLLLRWLVVAQAAAIEREGWLSALRRSASLVDGHYGYAFLLLVYVALLTTVPFALVGLGLGGDAPTWASFLAGTILQVFVWSFGALVTALAYFELRARFEARAPTPAASEQGGGFAPDGDPPRVADSWDLHAYSEADRPSGWYVDPGNPDRMRYWEGRDSPRWGASTRTPRKIKRAWEQRNPGGTTGRRA